MDPEALLADLDGDQRRAVTTDSRLVAVIAGAGSGKTRVLTRRVAYRVADQTATAAHTLVLTFTREAAGELRRRLPKLGLTDRVTAGTFHAFAQQLLRQRWDDTDQPARQIQHDRRRLIGDLENVKTGDVDDLVAEIEWAAARGLGPTGYERAARRGERRARISADKVADTMTRYATLKKRRGIVDLDDLLTMSATELERDPAFADATRWKFRHLLVDEAQDLNPTQHRLINLLRHGHDDLFMVGDPAQAIYAFNGSDPGILQNVDTHFPGTDVIRLPVNHRCTPQVVATGAAVLSTAGQATAARSSRGDGAAVEVHGHDDDVAEARWVAGRLARIDPSLVRSGDAAVLARTHAALAATRVACAEMGVDVRQPSARTAPIGVALGEVYRLAGNADLRRWAYDHSADGTDAEQSVGDAIQTYLRDDPTGSGAGFRAWVAAADPFGESAGGVELSTFHAAKGREWHTVAIIGAETGLVPHRSATTTASKAEEARLLYVAVTRATDVLLINYAARRGGYQRKASPLLAAVDTTPTPVLPPPHEILSRQRSPRALTVERLRAWRSDVARRSGVLPETICTDGALGRIADQRPATIEALEAATGWGAITSTRLFDDIEAALRSDPGASTER